MARVEAAEGDAAAAAAAAAAALVAALAPELPPPLRRRRWRSRRRASSGCTTSCARCRSTAADRDDVVGALRSLGDVRRREAALAREFGPVSESDDADEAEGGRVWAQFLAVGEVLRSYGALDDWEATELGALVGELAGDNELWLAIVMLEVAAKGNTLSASQLAAVLAATLDERVRPNSYIAFSASDGVLETLDELEGRADALADAQLDAGLDFTVALDGAVCGLVEAWAGGLAWGELVGQTSLDGGDIFRILRRTTDLLRQVALVPYVSETVQTRARDAYRAMSRYPLGTVGDPVVEAEGEGERGAEVTA